MSTKHASFATASSSAAPSTSAGNVQAVYDNLKEHILPELRINAQFFEEALQAILHTVLFVRATPDIRPKDVCCDKLAPVIYATCGIAALDGNVNNTIDLLKRSLIISSSGQNLRGEITLSFYQRREKSAGWLFTTNQTEHVYFERWRLPVTVLDFQNTSFAPSTGSGKMGNNLSASTMLSGANYGSAASNASQRRHSTGGHSATPGIGYFQQGAGGTVSEGVDDSGNASSSGDAMRMAYRSAYDQVTKAIMSIIETATSTSTQVPDVPYFFHLNVSDVTELRTSPAFNRGSGSGPGSAASSGKSGGHSGLHAALGAGRSSPMVPSGPGNTRR